ncbi:MAG: MOSC domain-containing protein [Bacteroidota bacterium]|nr:MOSC domain-containing protein [Bacteroidota bacterium]
MQLISVNIAEPSDVEWQGKTVRTSIFKQPVGGPIQVLADSLAGDGQADLRHHGGADKAVYAYPAEHWAYWSAQLPPEKLVPGAFGENLTTAGLLESEVRLGDCFRVGSAILKAMQPRVPCFKLNVRLDDDQMVRRFQRAGRSGIYFSIVQPGTVQAGDSIELLQRSEHAVTVQQVADCYYAREPDRPTVQAILEVPFLRPSLRAHFLALYEASR